MLEKKYLSCCENKFDKLDVVAVLGGGVSKNEYLREIIPSEETASRVLHAVQVFKQSGAAYLVCSGKGDGGLTEAEVMGISAERLGILKERIRLDKRSRNTREHAQEVSKMFWDRNLRIGLITSAYHMKRSEMEFRKYFSHLHPLPSDYLYSSPVSLWFKFLPNSNSFYKSSIALKEMMGLIWYKIRA